MAILARLLTSAELRRRSRKQSPAFPIDAPEITVAKISTKRRVISLLAAMRPLRRAGTLCVAEDAQAAKVNKAGSWGWRLGAGEEVRMTRHQ